MKEKVNSCSALFHLCVEAKFCKDALSASFVDLNALVTRLMPDTDNSMERCSQSASTVSRSRALCNMSST